MTAPTIRLASVLAFAYLLLAPAALFAQHQHDGQAAQQPQAAQCCQRHQADQSAESRPAMQMSRGMMDQAGQRGRGMMNPDQRGRGMMHDPAHDADRQVFFALFEHRAEITRKVTLRSDGIETVTESTNPEVTRLLQTHVVAMLARVKDARPIHLRDPLFAEIFRNADRIEAQHELTPAGIRVIETSSDPYVVKLLQAHAAVVDAFIANGHAEMMKNHPLPER